MKRFPMVVASGARAVKRQNYREKSVDVAGYDELAAFDDDIEQEGSPTFWVTSVLKARSGQSPSVAPRPK